MFRKIFLSEKINQQQQCHYFGPTKLLWNSFAGIKNFYTSKKGVTVVCQEKLYRTPKKFTVNLWRFKNGAFWSLSKRKEWRYHMLFADKLWTFLLLSQPHIAEFYFILNFKKITKRFPNVSFIFWKEQWVIQPTLSLTDLRGQSMWYRLYNGVRHIVDTVSWM